MTDKQLSMIMGEFKSINERISNLEEKVDDLATEVKETKRIANTNREHLVYLTEEITGIKINQKEIEEKTKEDLEERDRKAEDYQQINERDHREIIDIIEKRVRTLQEEDTQLQNNTSKMQLCHA